MLERKLGYVDLPHEMAGIVVTQSSVCLSRVVVPVRGANFRDASSKFCGITYINCTSDVDGGKLGVGRVEPLWLAVSGGSTLACCVSLT